MHFRHAKEKRDLHSLKYRGWQVFVTVAIFWTVVSIIPVYNKVVFSGAAGDQGFPYPLTTTCFQLCFCAFTLTLCSVIRHTFGLQPKDSSWVFDKQFWYKARVTSRIGILFGLKFGVTNWGLHVLNLAPHLLLQSTDLMWTVVFAHLINRETLDFKESLCCVGSIMGTMLIAYRTHQEVPEMFPLLINLMSPILLGLCVSELRKAARILLIEENRPEGMVPHMDAFELTAFKLWFSTLVVIPFAYYFEVVIADPSVNSLNLCGETSVLIRLRQQSLGLTLAAVGGGFLILIFQVNVTWLCRLTSAVSVGIVGGVKVIPQWFFAVALSQNIDLSIYNILGAVILLSSSILWTKIKYGNIEANVKSMQHNSDELQRQNCALLPASESKPISNRYGSMSLDPVHV